MAEEEAGGGGSGTMAVSARWNFACRCRVIIAGCFQFFRAQLLCENIRNVVTCFVLVSYIAKFIPAMRLINLINKKCRSV